MPRRALLLAFILLLVATAADRGVELRGADYGVAYVEADDFAGLWFGYEYAQFASHGDLTATTPPPAPPAGSTPYPPSPVRLVRSRPARGRSASWTTPPR